MLEDGQVSGSERWETCTQPSHLSTHFSLVICVCNQKGFTAQPNIWWISCLMPQRWCVTWLRFCILVCERPHTATTPCKMPQLQEKGIWFRQFFYSGQQTMSCFESTISELCISCEMLKAMAFTLSPWLRVSPLTVHAIFVVVAVFPYFGFAFSSPSSSKDNSSPYLPNTLKRGRCVCLPRVLLCPWRVISTGIWHSCAKTFIFKFLME